MGGGSGESHTCTVCGFIALTIAGIVMLPLGLVRKASHSDSDMVRPASPRSRG